MMTAHNVSERTACQLASVSRTGYRYQRKVRHDDALRQRLKELAAKQVAYGYLFLHRLLKNEGLVVRILAHVDHRFWKRLITHSGLS